MMTREEYMNTDSKIINGKYCDKKAQEMHNEYYSQFVNPNIINLVVDRFGRDKLATAYEKDIHLNNLGGNHPWDRIEPMIRMFTSSKLLKEAREGWSSCTSICIAKAAARIAILNRDN